MVACIDHARTLRPASALVQSGKYVVRDATSLSSAWPALVACRSFVMRLRRAHGDQARSERSPVEAPTGRDAHRVRSRESRNLPQSRPPPFGFRTEKSAGAGESVEYILYAIVRKKPPRKLALPIGDAIQNIRSALEHLAYLLASPRAQKSGKTAFPIFTDECQFKVIGVPRIETIRGDERTLIERVQPYAASKVPDDDPLEVLRKLSNLDKHQLLVPMIAAVDLRESWVASDNADIRFRYIARGPVEHDTKIVAFTATPKDPAIDMNVQPGSGLQYSSTRPGSLASTSRRSNSSRRSTTTFAHSIIEMWFERGFMPKTWTEVHPPQ
jgi:hypothetical protein